MWTQRNVVDNNSSDIERNFENCRSTLEGDRNGYVADACETYSVDLRDNFAFFSRLINAFLGDENLRALTTDTSGNERQITSAIVDKDERVARFRIARNTLEVVPRLRK